MPGQDYFVILPLLLYGLAIADLVNSWRSFFVSQRRYAPYIITSLLLLEISFWNFYQMHEWMGADTFSSYLSYFKILLPPLVFLLVVAVFTPDSDVIDIKGYFIKQMPIIFGGLAVFTALHFLFDWDKNVVPRMVGIVLLVSTAIWRKEWMIYLLLVFRVSSWFFQE